MRILARTLSLATLATLAAAQDEMVLQQGDPVTGMPGTTISSFTSHGIASTGDWWAAARFSAPSPDGNILVINGVTEFKFGDPIPGGRTFLRPISVDFTAGGDRAIHCLALDGSGNAPQHALLWNDQLVAIQGMPIVDAGGAVVGPVNWIQEFVLDGSDRILARVSVGPVLVPLETVLVEIDPTPTGPLEAQLLLGRGALYPDGSEVQSVDRVDINARGDVMTAGRERSSAGADFLRAVRVNGDLRLRTGDIEPTTGATWDLEGFVVTATTVDFDLDAQGEVVVYGDLIGPGFTINRAIARGNTLIARAGQAPAGSNLPITQVDPYGMTALPDGRVFWSGFEPGSANKILFLGNQRYLEPGDELLGSTVTRIVQFSNALIQPFPENGGFFLHRVSLADGRVGLLRRSLSIGRFGCSQGVVNSSGNLARLEARGSDLVGGHELTLAATGLPSNQMGLFVVGASAGVIFIPGSQGSLCLGGAIGRFNNVFQASADGTANLQVNTEALPVNTGGGQTTAVLPGDTWHFQCWFRDNNPAATSNLSDSVLVTFR